MTRVGSRLAQRLSGMAVSTFSALLLFWQWYRRRGVGGPSDYLQACTGLELEVRRAWHDGTLDQACADDYLDRLTKLRLDVLEKQQAGLLPADEMLVTVLSRLDYLQETLDELAASPPGAAPRPSAARRRPAA